MIKQLFQQIVKKRRHYWITIIIMFLSFYVIAVLTNAGYENFVKSFSPRLSIPIENRVELFMEWNTKEMNKEQQSIRDQLKRRVNKLSFVESSEYVVNDCINFTRFHSYDKYSDNTYLLYCGVDFDEVFDLELSKGEWFKTTGSASQFAQVVITENHANELGIEVISNETTFVVPYKMGQKMDSITYQVVGIVSNLENMRKSGKLEKTIFPIFISVSANKNLYSSFLDERMILKMKKNFSFENLNDDVVTLLDDHGISKYLHQYQLVTLKKRMRQQLLNHFETHKLLYGLVFVLLSYLFVTLFGNFWKISRARTHEIGIRRAIGHRRSAVIWYIMMEALSIYLLVISAAIILLISFPIPEIHEFPILVFVISGTIILMIVIIAASIPAVRAGSINPIVALAEE